jgi:hypothetical protein
LRISGVSQTQLRKAIIFYIIDTPVQAKAIYSVSASGR